jgi:hypothetical protein
MKIAKILEIKRRKTAPSLGLDGAKNVITEK